MYFILKENFPVKKLYMGLCLNGTRDCSEKGKEFAKKAGQYFKKKQIYNISAVWQEELTA